MVLDYYRLVKYSCTLNFASTSCLACDISGPSYGIPQGAVLTALIVSIIYINDFHNSSKLFEFHLFADDANLFYEHESLQQLQENINAELINIHTWLCANKLSLNIEKSNFRLFHTPQKKLQDSSLNLKLLYAISNN